MKHNLNFVLFVLSFSMLSMVFLIFLFSFIGFLFHQSINALYPCLSLLISMLIIYVLLKNKECPKRTWLITYLIYFFVLAASFLLSMFFWDNSYDGHTYHQGTVIFLEMGWNPIFDNFGEFSKNIFNTDLHGVKWIEYYPKFCEIVQANIFHIFKNIEIAKMLNLIMCFIVFGYSYFILCKDRFNNHLNNFTKILISFLIVFNPVIIAQMFTFYIDSYVYLLFMLILLAIFDLETQTEKQHLAFCTIVMSSVCLINVKLGGILYGIVPIFTYFVFLIFKRQKIKLKTLSYCVVLIAILGVLSGINPYFTNIKQNRHPLYPLAGKGKVDVITNQQPKSFKDRFFLSNVAVSYFSQVDNILASSNRSPKLKIPFSIHKEELKYLSVSDTRICGFGILWSGIILLTIFLIFNIRYARKEDKNLDIVVWTILLTLFIFNPYSWWARYAAHLWFIPIFACLLILSNKNIHILKRVIAYTVLLLMLVNISVQTVTIVIRDKKHHKMYASVINKAKNSNEIIKICSIYDYAFIEKMIENKVKFEIVDKKTISKHKEEFSLIPHIKGEEMYWNYKDKSE